MIKFNIRGENVEVTDAIRAYVEDKIGKLDKYFNDGHEVTHRQKLVLLGQHCVVYGSYVSYIYEFDVRVFLLQNQLKNTYLVKYLLHVK